MHLPHTMTNTTTVELPQIIRLVICNSSGTDVSVSVSTYDGPGDITLLTSEEFHTLILDPFGQSGAATLVAPAFGLASATLETLSDESNRNKVLKLAFPMACEEIKKTSCPGWNHCSAQIFDNVK